MKYNIKYFTFCIFFIFLFTALLNSSVYAKRNRPIEPKTIHSLGCSDISPVGKIADIFNIGSSYTDLQREDVLEKIKGDVVCWKIVVYEVNKDGNMYKVFSNPTRNSVGSIIYIDGNFIDSSSKELIHSLKTGDLVGVKGILTGKTFMRSLIIDPAVLINLK